MADPTDTSNLGFSSNPYLQQQVNDSLGNTVRAYNLTTQPAYNAAMVNSGSFGNSGVQQMNGEAQRQLQMSLGQQSNNMLSDNYWNGMGFDKNVYDTTFGQNQQNFQNGLNLMGLQNGINTQNLGLGTQIQNTPMGYYGNFNQQANSIGQGYGTSTGTMNAQGSPLMGALGGYQLANKIYQGMPSGSSGSSPTNYGSDWNGTQGGTMNNPSAYVAPSY